MATKLILEELKKEGHIDLEELVTKFEEAVLQDALDSEEKWREFQSPPGYETEWEHLQDSMKQLDKSDPDQLYYINLINKHINDLSLIKKPGDKNYLGKWWTPEVYIKGFNVSEWQRKKPKAPRNWNDLREVHKFLYGDAAKSRKKIQLPLAEKMTPAEKRAIQAKLKLIRKLKEQSKKLMVYPKDKCPQNVMLPFDPKPYDELGKRIYWIDQKLGSLIISPVRLGKAKPLTPGWLINLQHYDLSCLNLVRQILTEINLEEDIVGPVESIYFALRGISGVEVKKSNILRLIKLLPKGSEGGLSFPVFLLGLANFQRTEKYKMFISSPRSFKTKGDPNISLEKILDEQEPTPPPPPPEPKKPHRRKPLVPVLYYDHEGNLWDRYEKDMNSASSSAEEEPPFSIRNKLDYTPLKERKPMKYWRKRIRVHRERHKQARLEKMKARKDEDIEEKLARERFAREREEAIENEKKTVIEEKLQKEEKARQNKVEKQRQRIEDYDKRVAFYKEKGLCISLQERLLDIDEDRKANYKGRKLPFMKPDKFTKTEKVAYSGLLFFYMHDFMQRVTQIYKSQFLPDLEFEEEKIQKPCRPPLAETCPRYKLSEWDKICPSKQQNLKNSHSIYLQPLDMVTRKKLLIPPDSETIMTERIKVKDDYLRMNLPNKGDGPITLTENRGRIKKIIQYLYKRDKDPLALLPHLHEIIHYSEPYLRNSIQIRKPKVPIAPASATSEKNQYKPAKLDIPAKSFLSLPALNDATSIRKENLKSSHSLAQNQVVKTKSSDKIRNETSKVRYATSGARQRAKEIAAKKIRPRQSSIRPSSQSRGSSKSSKSHKSKKSKSSKIKKGQKIDLNIWLKSEAQRLQPNRHIPKYLVTKENALELRDATILRKRYDYYIKNQWKNLIKKRLKFREDLWRKLDVGGIESERMRNAFIHTFFNMMPRRPVNQPVIPYSYNK